MALNEEQQELLNHNYGSIRPKECLQYCIELPYIVDNETFDEISHWLNANWQHHHDTRSIAQMHDDPRFNYFVTNHMDISDPLRYYFFFSHLDDALLFKLTWG